MPAKKFRVFATADIGDSAFNRLRERGYEIEIYPNPEPPPKSLIIEKVRSGIDGLITTRRRFHRVGGHCLYMDFYLTEC